LREVIAHVEDGARGQDVLHELFASSCGGGFDGMYVLHVLSKEVLEIVVDFVLSDRLGPSLPFILSHFCFHELGRCFCYTIFIITFHSPSGLHKP
jgi:hypothetical protein